MRIRINFAIDTDYDMVLGNWLGYETTPMMELFCDMLFFAIMILDEKVMQAISPDSYLKLSNRAVSHVVRLNFFLIVASGVKHGGFYSSLENKLNHSKFRTSLFGPNLGELGRLCEIQGL